MKPLLALLAAGVSALLFTPIGVRAGSAVAADGHGAFGYAYGNEPLEELRQKAHRNCCRESRHPEAVRVVFQTQQRGHGVVLRYYVRGGERIAASGGASSPRAAQRSAVGFVEQQGGERWEVADTWVDE